MNVRDIFANLPPLETNRLILRKLESEDEKSVFEILSKPEVVKFMSWERLETLKDAKTFVDLLIQRYKDQKPCHWGVILKENHKLIGLCGFHDWSESNLRADLAFALSLDYWNCGFITEALTEVIRFGFVVMGMNRIQSTVKPENVGSFRVMEKCGMVMEGLLREYEIAKGIPHDLKIYSIIKKEFKSFGDN